MTHLERCGNSGHSKRYRRYTMKIDQVLADFKLARYADECERGVSFQLCVRSAIAELYLEYATVHFSNTVHVNVTA